jgi:hypothetical protein
MKLSCQRSAISFQLSAKTKRGFLITGYIRVDGKCTEQVGQMSQNQRAAGRGQRAAKAIKGYQIRVKQNV